MITSIFMILFFLVFTLAQFNINKRTKFKDKKQKTNKIPCLFHCCAVKISHAGIQNIAFFLLMYLYRKVFLIHFTHLSTQKWLYQVMHYIQNKQKQTRLNFLWFSKFFPHFVDYCLDFFSTFNIPYYTAHKQLNLNKVCFKIK